MNVKLSKHFFVINEEQIIFIFDFVEFDLDLLNLQIDWHEIIRIIMNNKSHNRLCSSAWSKNHRNCHGIIQERSDDAFKQEKLIKYLKDD